MKKILAVIFLFLLSDVALAQIITIGVQPSVVDLDFYKSSSYNVEFLFFNSKGDTNATYVLSDTCVGIVKNYPKEVFVPNGTIRIINPVKEWIRFEPDFTGNKLCYLKISIKESADGNLNIKREVGVKLNVSQPSQSQGYRPEHDSVSIISFQPTTTVQSTIPQSSSETNSETNIETTETTIKTIQEEVKEEFGNFNTTYILIGVVTVFSVLAYIFKDRIISGVSSMFSFLFIFLLSSQLASAINVSVNVIPATTTTLLPLPPARFVQVFPIGGLLIPVLLSIVVFLAMKKLLLEELKFDFKTFITFILGFAILIIFVTGLSYVFSAL